MMYPNKDTVTITIYRYEKLVYSIFAKLDIIFVK